jgi:hypothetical protein
MHVRLKRHYSVIAHSADEVELRLGTWNPISFVLSDSAGSGALFRILSRLDGRMSPTDIAAAECVPRRDVEQLLDKLADLDLLETSSSQALDYYLDHLVPSLLPYQAARDRRPASVVLLGAGQIPQEIARILTESPLEGRFDVLADNDHLRRRLENGTTPWLRDGLAFEEAA